ncbi:MAG TPA: hypothetical protein VHH11_18010 [Gammaproteobacteria bacterium]|jgi:hypothetical protein|nr:hypothetical protein [Gammaproteobacteria bacterium]
MSEKIRAWLTPALLAVIALLLYRLVDAVEDVADTVEDTCLATDSPGAQIASALDRR